jgi:hypothetical protein
MAARPELLVIDRAYELVRWSCAHIGRFPRQYRFTLGERIERRLYDLLETLVQARYTRDRHGLLQRANLGLEVLRFQVRLAYDLRCLRTTSYLHAVERLHEIGCMVGGWAKAASPAHRPGTRE